MLTADSCPAQADKYHDYLWGSSKVRHLADIALTINLVPLYKSSWFLNSLTMAKNFKFGPRIIFLLKKVFDAYLGFQLSLQLR